METEIKNRKSWIWTVVILIIVVVLIFWVRYISNSSANINTQNTGVNPVDDTALTPVSTEDTTTGDVNAGTAVSLSYTDALVKYADARLQLDDNCQALASPSNLIFKNNAYLMVDNRAPVARTVHIGSVFSIKAYGFKIIQLYSAKLPATFLVDCGTSQNVATITLEK